MDQFFLAITVLFHPVDTFRMIQMDRRRFHYLPPVVLLLLAFAARMFYLYQVHFPLTELDVWNTTLWIEAVKFLLPIVTWIVALSAITAVMGGQSLFREILIATSLAFVPYTLVSVAAALLSHVMSRSELFFFNMILVVMWAWVVVLIIAGIYTMNDYSARKTLVVILMSVVAVFLIWLIVILVYSLINQIVDFIAGIVQEVRMKTR